MSSTVLSEAAGSDSSDERYEIREEIGRDGMGVVRKARDRMLGHLVALKTPLDTLSDEDAERIIEEARHTIQLKHPNIVRIYDIQMVRIPPSGVPRECIVMEYIDGPSLREYLVSHKRLPPSQVIEIAEQVASALDYAHRRGVVHCDVKPANVLVSQATHPDAPHKIKITMIDFGLARHIAQIGPAERPAGTLVYGAPEQLNPNGKYDHRVDVFSLSVTIYELLTGERPAGGQQARHGPVGENSIPAITTGYDAEVDQVLAKAMAWRPEDRYPNVKEFCSALLLALTATNSPSSLGSVGSRSVSPKILAADHASPLDLDHLVGVCHSCGREIWPYNPNETRFCCTKYVPRDVSARFGAGGTIKNFPTIFPEPAEHTDAFLPPHPGSRPIPDGFLVGTPGEQSSQTYPSTPALPYPDSRLTDHLRCGNATLNSMGDRSTLFQFKANKIWVCDMSTYSWSHTLKDPRSLAIIKTAVHYGIRHLGVWTAGNAGLSLARVAYAVNRLLPRRERITVYSYAYRGDVPEDIERQIEIFGGRLAILTPPPKGSVFSSDETRQHLNAKLGLNISQDEYWDVSDGWDGVGMYMYRLLGRQLCAHVKPRHIVAPIGTGNLFYGLFLGRKDCEERGLIQADDCHLIGAVPLGSSVVENYKGEFGLSLKNVIPARGSERPVAPKLDTIYTPLLLTLYNALISDSVTIIQVSADEQREVEGNLIQRSDGPEIAAEPSALITFAALTRLARQEPDPTITKYSDACFPEEEVVVVNSGCGSRSVPDNARSCP